jgi:hypothetical protein
LGPPKINQSINQSSIKPTKNEQSQQLRQFKVLEVELWQAQHSLYAQHVLALHDKFVWTV